jgi:WD40 repeat protein
VGTWKSANQFVQGDPVQATVFSPDGKFLFWAVGGTQSRMIRWREPFDPPENKNDPAAAKRPRVIPPIRNIDTAGGLPLGMASGVLQAANQQPQPRLCVACADKTVKVFNIAGGLVTSLVGHGDWVYCVAVGADGKKIASGSADGTVKLWSFAENRALATLVRFPPEKDDWLIVTTPGYFTTSTPAAIGWAPLGSTTPPEKIAKLFAKPDLVRECLAGKKVAPAALK